MTSSPTPLGATRNQSGWNFAIYSTTPIYALCIAPVEDPAAIREITTLECTGSIYHTCVPSNAPQLYYGYRLEPEGPILIDPRALLLDTGNRFGSNLWGQFQDAQRLYGIAMDGDNFEWENDAPLHTPLDLLVIYELHVRGFTQHPTSGVAHPGTYLGLIEKIPYLKALGITAVELLPIQEWNESEYTANGLPNVWGYSPLSFFAPMQRFATTPNPLQGLHELKTMVRALHREGISVFLDVVFNHTGEGNEHGPTFSWKGFAAEEYYIHIDGSYANYSGCGNTCNCNNPLMQDLIVDAMRYWVTECHVDGFRFDLASILTRDQAGAPLLSAPLIERITNDPYLKQTTLIAEPWDAAGSHQVGTFAKNVWQGEERWSEWNDDYRNVVRRFINGTPNQAGRFATKLCGSSDIYPDGSPLNSINFVTCHDGFTLHDLTAYNGKHNLANGEQNRDGMNENDSFNCGAEGPTTKPSILNLRLQQAKNFLMALSFSQGIPMFLMGDEQGRTQDGNNNSWCQDSLNQLLWHDQPHELTIFLQQILTLRRSYPLLHEARFLTDSDIRWHGLQPDSPDWDESSQLVAFSLHDQATALYIAFNTAPREQVLHLPAPPPGTHWYWLLCSRGANNTDKRSGRTIHCPAHTAIVLCAKP